MKTLFVMEKPLGTGAPVDPDAFDKKLKMYEKLMKPKEYVCRVYVICGYSVGGEEKKNMYLEIVLGSKKKELKHDTLN